MKNESYFVVFTNENEKRSVIKKYFIILFLLLSHLHTITSIIYRSVVSVIPNSDQPNIDFRLTKMKRKRKTLVHQPLLAKSNLCNVPVLFIRRPFTTDDSDIDFGTMTNKRILRKHKSKQELMRLQMNLACSILNSFKIFKWKIKSLIMKMTRLFLLLSVFQFR